MLQSSKFFRCTLPTDVAAADVIRHFQDKFYSRRTTMRKDNIATVLSEAEICITRRGGYSGGHSGPPATRAVRLMESTIAPFMPLKSMTSPSHNARRASARPRYRIRKSQPRSAARSGECCWRRCSVISSATPGGRPSALPFWVSRPSLA